MASTRKAVHLFNCDKLCNLSEVEVLLKVVEKKVSFKISPIKKHQFRREQIANMVDQTIPKLKTVDYAVFVVHAGEGCLSFNEDNGYGKIYEALKKRTGSGEKVLIVIAGDENYKDKNEEDECFLSLWAKDTISRQFRTELLDGRKSFIFSWNQKHRPIHEEALLHYFDPSKKGQKFVYQPEPEPASSPHRDIQQEEPETSVQEPTDTQEAMVSPADEGDGGRETSNEINESEIQVSSESSEDSASWGNLKLQTRLRYGTISYDSKDVETWDRSWRPSKTEVEHLEKEWKSTRDAYLKIFVDGNGKQSKVIVDPVNTIWDYCSIS